jgi:pimeloyl-ACP methyl ester carboxylesterase
MTLYTTAALVFLAAAPTPKAVTFQTDDGWTIHADDYGTSDRAVVLVHGGRFTKASWKPQVPDFLAAGFRVLAIDMRGFGMSQDGPAQTRGHFGSPHDVLAAVRYLKASGAKTVSLVGGSMGGAQAADAAAQARPGEVGRVVLLGASANEPPQKLTFRKLYITTRDDRSGDAPGTPRLPRIQAQFDAAPEPKQLIVLEGSAHAQFMFDTDLRERVMREILRFLTAP